MLTYATKRVLLVGVVVFGFPCARCLGQQATVIQASLGSNNHLVVPVSINGGEKPWWIVDTGAPISVISREQAASTGLQRIDSGSGMPAAPIVESHRVKVLYAASMVSEGFDFGGEELAVLGRGTTLSESTRTKNKSDFRPAGIIGLHTLAKYGAVINCRVRQIFLNPAGGGLPLPREGYEKMGFVYIPLDFTTDHHIEAVGTIGSNNYSFLIDTGSEFTFIAADIQRQEHIPFYDRQGILLGIHDFNKATISSGSLPNFRLGDCSLNRTAVGFVDLNLRISGLSQPFAGLIGADILYYHSAIIDVGNRALYLKPQGS
jgi:Aspartyl protease